MEKPKARMAVPGLRNLALVEAQLTSFAYGGMDDWRKSPTVHQSYTSDCAILAGDLHTIGTYSLRPVTVRSTLALSIRPN